MFRVAGAYALVAWVMMQAGEIVFPAFELPNSALRLLIICLIAGLPCVIVLAWVLDVTPTGIRWTRRFSEAAASDDGDAQHAHDDPTKLGRSLEMILLGICIPVFAFAIVLLVVSRGAEDVGDPTSPPSVPSSMQALAVLPFEDLSMGVDDAGFFARGMHEDILTHLARVKPLKLISRTSVMSYEGTTKNLAVIGRELGVNHILEGSVRRTKTHVRVTAQLLKTETDEHVWAETFDAEISDVFAVQSRIAEAIADALETEFSPRATSGKVASSVDPAAYDAYLKARDIHRNLDAEDRTALSRARHLYEAALQNDESLAAAWLQLGVLHAQAYWFGFDPSPDRARLARKSLERARATGIDADQLAIAEGILSYYLDQDFGKALLQFRHAADLAPGQADAHFYQGMILRRSGELEAALDAQAAALELDPLNLGYRDEYALTLSLAGRLTEAREELRVILRSDPKRLRARFQKWQLDLELDGRPGELLREILASPRDRWRDQHYAMLETVAVLAGRPEVALEILSARPATRPDSGYLDYQRAMLAGFSGRPEEKAEGLARSESKFDALLARQAEGPGAMWDVDRRRIQAMFALQAGDWDRAIRLQRANVDALPIEKDLIVGHAPLWLLLHVQLVAGRVEDALTTLERLRARVAIGSIPYGGHYVLAHWPEFAEARRDPRWRALLDRIRPEYAERWPEPERDAGDAL